MLGEILIVLSALFWAGTFVIYKKALNTADPITISFFSSVFASIFLFLVFSIAYGPYELLLIDRIALLNTLWAVLFSLVIGGILYLGGMKIIGVALSVPIYGSYPLFSVVFSVMLLKETLTFPTVIGSMSIFLGAVMVASFDSHIVLSSEKKTWFKGVLMSLCSAVCFGLGGVFFKIALGGVEAMKLTTIRAILSVPMLLAPLLLLGRWNALKRISSRDLGVMSLSGTVGLGLGGITFFKGLSTIPASRAIPLSSITPLFSTILAVSLLHERVNTRTVLGTILIVVGSALLVD